MARQDYTGGNQDQMDRQSAAAAAAGRPDVDTGSQGEGGGRQDGPGSVNFGVTGAGTGTGAVEYATAFRLGGPGSTVITRTPLQQFRFNRDTDRANRVASYTPANIAEFEAATGRTRTNPYGPNGMTGMAQKIFGVENVQLDQLDPGKQAEYNAIYNLNLDKFMNPDLQSKIGLRGMVGDPVTGGNTIAKQVAPMSRSEMGARLGITAATPFGPLLSILPGNNVSYVSTGNEEVYDVERDPRFNKDLGSGIMGNLMKTFSGGTDLQEAGGRVMDLGRQGLDSLTERFGANDLDVPAGVMGNLERPMDKYAGQRGRDLMADQITPAGLPVSSPAPYEIQSSPMLDTLRDSDDQAFLSEQFGLTPSQMMLNARELNQDVGLPGGNLQLEYNPDTNTKGIQYNVPINSLLRMLG